MDGAVGDGGRSGVGPSRLRQFWPGANVEVGKTLDDEVRGTKETALGEIVFNPPDAGEDRLFVRHDGGGGGGGAKRRAR